MWRDEEIRGDPGDTAALTCIDEGVGDDQSTATNVDDDGGILHRIELGPADESARVVGEGGGEERPG